ncbi:outer membrane beta-barrel protein [Algoriphagus halophytocola]|uniref:Outer membrane beta-barrel protein n=1 Tax=Algoriphagus halophytocola TaxID=2991499 RepID=A0ABY6MGD7_9BACT|nr:MULTISPECIES: outer membrane beta-barrel protein [unclassified Algoriphagus]UZD21249.1 outer membrane beta-barrel protein [Algoriphagus sp. TR-M5]WBL42460.1 outer membrane beta-barrel protein [Algoriphagus sp. TR-M9]
MKKLLLGLLVFQLFNFSTNAQIEKGSIFVGGRVNYAHNNNDSESRIINPSVVTANNVQSNQFTFNPQLGYTLNNNLVIGTYLGINSYKATSDRIQLSDGSTTGFEYLNKNNSLIIGVFARKYIAFSESFSAFAEINAGTGKINELQSSEDTNGTQEEIEQNFNKFESNFNIGLSFFPKKWMAIELSSNLLYFSHQGENKETENQKSEVNANGFNIGLNASAINVGVSFFLNNK